MTVIVNPFDAGGFTLAEMSAAIQMLPNPYGRVGQLGLFAPEPISQRNVTIESIEGELRLLPAVAPGAPATVGTTDNARCARLPFPTSRTTMWCCRRKSRASVAWAWRPVKTLWSP